MHRHGTKTVALANLVLGIPWSHHSLLVTVKRHVVPVLTDSRQARQEIRGVKKTTPVGIARRYPSCDRAELVRRSDRTIIGPALRHVSDDELRVLVGY